MRQVDNSQHLDFCSYIVLKEFVRDLEEEGSDERKTSE